MSLIGITLLEMSVPERSEQRDALDRRWPAFLDSCGLCAVLLPNHEAMAASLLANLPLAGVILSGGGEPGLRTARGGVEQLVFDWSVEGQKPVLGVCRGMQAMLARDGVRAAKIERHVATRHSLCGTPSREVNSYHELGFVGDLPGYRVIARAPDGTAEWVRHETRQWAGIMWHPERELVPQQPDVELISKWFTAGAQ